MVAKGDTPIYQKTREVKEKLRSYGYQGLQRADLQRRERLIYSGAEAHTDVPSTSNALYCTTLTYLTIHGGGDSRGEIRHRLM